MQLIFFTDLVFCGLTVLLLCFVYSLGYSIYKIMSYANRDSCTSFLPNFLEHPVQCWTKVMRTGILVSFLILRENFQAFTVKYDVMLFIRLRKFPSIPSLLNVFIMKGRCMLSNVFSESTQMIMWFLSFFSTEEISYIDWFSYVEPTLHS